GDPLERPRRVAPCPALRVDPGEGLECRLRSQRASLSVGGDRLVGGLLLLPQAGGSLPARALFSGVAGLRVHLALRLPERREALELAGRLEEGREILQGRRRDLVAAVFLEQLSERAYGAHRIGEEVGADEGGLLQELAPAVGHERQAT